MTRKNHNQPPQRQWKGFNLVLGEEYREPFRDLAEELGRKHMLKAKQVLYFAERPFYHTEEAFSEGTGLDKSVVRWWKYKGTGKTALRFRNALEEWEQRKHLLYAYVLRKLVPIATDRVARALEATFASGHPDFTTQLKAAELIFRSVGMYQEGARYEVDEAQKGFYQSLKALIDEKRAQLALPAPRREVVDAEIIHRDVVEEQNIGG